MKKINGKYYTKGGLYRELVSRGKINDDSSETFVVQYVSCATREEDDVLTDGVPQFGPIPVTFTECFRTLEEAQSSIDLAELSRDNGGICFYNCIGTDDENFDSNDNEDIATYLITSLDRKTLFYVIRNQCLIPFEKLEKMLPKK